MQKHIQRTQYLPYLFPAPYKQIKKNAGTPSYSFPLITNKYKKITGTPHYSFPLITNKYKKMQVPRDISFRSLQTNTKKRRYPALFLSANYKQIQKKQVLCSIPFFQVFLSSKCKSLEPRRCTYYQTNTKKNRMYPELCLSCSLQTNTKNAGTPHYSFLSSFSLK